MEDLEPLSRGIDELDRRHRKGIADFTQKLPSQVWQVGRLGEALGSDAIAVTDEAVLKPELSLSCVFIPFLFSLSDLQAHEEVRFLLYRLDFTEFYSKKAAPADDVSDDGMMMLD